MQLFFRQERQPLRRQSAVHRAHQLVFAHRLLQIVDHAVPQGAHGGIERGIAGHEDDRAIGVVPLDDLGHVQPGKVRHLQIDDGEVDVRLAQLVLYLAGIRQGPHPIAFVLQDPFDQIAGILIVIDDERANVHR